MKSCRLFAVLLTLLPFVELSAQDVAFKFVEKDLSKIDAITRIISIDKRQDSIYYAYANEKELSAFLAMGYKPQYDTAFLRREKASFPMANSLDQMMDFDRYPTYELYLQMMNKWVDDYPDLCKLDTIGYSVQGRLILAVKISDNVSIQEPEPEFLYTSSMHGDELTGYVLMLRLIDYMLSQYETDSVINKLLNETQLYINPISNPDGAYARGNSTVDGAKRYNSLNVDLNRNYPDISNKPNDSLQVENKAMIEFVEKHNFIMSGSLHTGAEVLNFPWDSYISSILKHPDYKWWIEIDKQYIDSCRLVDKNCFKDVHSSGYVAGGDWYVVYNGRQDYFSRKGVKEQTFELSTIKTFTSSSMLVSYWNINKKSLINYILNVHKGINGVVKDSLTRDFLNAKIEIENRDKSGSEAYSYLPHGVFYKPIEKGTYDIIISADGYLSKKIENVELKDESIFLDIALLTTDYTDTIPSDSTSVEFINSQINKIKIYPNPVAEEISVSLPENWRVESISSITGNLRSNISYNKNKTINVSYLPNGIYIIRFISREGLVHSERFVKL